MQTKAQHWWFQLTTPKIPANPTFLQKEAIRRAQVASLTIGTITIFGLLPLFQAVIQRNTAFTATMLITILVNTFALYLNRRGYLWLGGAITLLFLLAGLTLTVLKTPGGLSFQSWQALDLLVEDLVVVVAFLPPLSIFGVAFLNILITILLTYFAPHTLDFSLFLASSPYLLLYPPISLNAYIAIVTFIWVRSYAQAVQELDQSETLVAAQRSRQEALKEIDILNTQLSDGIAVLQNTLGAAANGDFAARAELLQENRLWQLARSLNLLLSRLASIRQQQQDAQRTEHEIRALAALLRERHQKGPLPIRLTNTPLDELLVTLSEKENAPFYVQNQKPSSIPPYR